MFFAGTFAIALMSFAACGGGQDVDLGPCPPDSESIQQEGANLIQFSCTAFCHSETRTGELRDGAPVGMDFDTPEQIVEWAEDIYVSVARTENPMPPNGGMLPRQIYAVQVYMACLKENQGQ